MNDLSSRGKSITGRYIRLSQISLVSYIGGLTHWASINLLVSFIQPISLAHAQPANTPAGPNPAGMGLTDFTTNLFANLERDVPCLNQRFDSLAPLLGNAVDLLQDTRDAMREGGVSDSTGQRTLGGFGTRCPTLTDIPDSSSYQCSTLQNASAFAAQRLRITNARGAVACHQAALNYVSQQVACSSQLHTKIQELLAQAQTVLQAEHARAAEEIRLMDEANQFVGQQIGKMAEFLGVPTREGQAPGGLIAAQGILRALMTGAPGQDGQGGTPSFEQTIAALRNGHQNIANAKQSVQFLREATIASNARSCFVSNDGANGGYRCSSLAGNNPAPASPPANGAEGGAAGQPGGESRGDGQTMGFSSYISCMGGNSTAKGRSGGTAVRAGSANAQLGAQFERDLNSALNRCMAEIPDPTAVEALATETQQALASPGAGQEGQSSGGATNRFNAQIAGRNSGASNTRTRSFRDFERNCGPTLRSRFTSTVDLNGKSFSVADVVLSKMNSCFRQANDRISKDTSAQRSLTEANNQIRAQTENLNAQVSGQLEKYNIAMQNITTAMTGMPIPLRDRSIAPTACNRTPGDQLSCLQRASTSLRNLLEGPMQFVKSFPGRPPQIAEKTLSCNGINECVPRLQNMQRELGQQLETAVNARNNRVNQWNQAFRMRAGAMKSAMARLNRMMAERLGKVSSRTDLGLEASEVQRNQCADYAATDTQREGREGQPQPPSLVQPPEGGASALFCTPPGNVEGNPFEGMLPRIQSKLTELGPKVSEALGALSALDARRQQCSQDRAIQQAGAHVGPLRQELRRYLEGQCNAAVPCGDSSGKMNHETVSSINEALGRLQGLPSGSEDSSRAGDSDFSPVEGGQVCSSSGNSSGLNSANYESCRYLRSNKDAILAGLSTWTSCLSANREQPAADPDPRPVTCAGTARGSLSTHANELASIESLSAFRDAIVQSTPSAPTLQDVNGYTRAINAAVQSCGGGASNTGQMMSVSDCQALARSIRSKTTHLERGARQAERTVERADN